MSVNKLQEKFIKELSNQIAGNNDINHIVIHYFDEGIVLCFFGRK